MNSVKSTPEERAIDQEIKAFMKFLRQDEQVTEVNFDKENVTYRIGSTLVSVTFKVNKK